MISITSSAQGYLLEDVLPLVPEKFKSRGVDVNAIDPVQFLERKPEFERDWERRLSYLVSGPNAISFAEAWQVSAELLKTLKKWE